MKDTVPPSPPPTPDKGFVLSVNHGRLKRQADPSLDSEPGSIWASVTTFCLGLFIVIAIVMCIVALANTTSAEKETSEVPTPDQMHLVWITVTEPNGKRVSVPWLLPTNITFTIDK